MSLKQLSLAELIIYLQRAFATETTQFLAPFESSIKSKARDSPTQSCGEDAVIAPMGSSASTTDVSHAIGKYTRNE